MPFETANKRPVHLDLFRIRLPVPGVLSILHRITGVLLFLAIPALIYLLDLSLISASGFHSVAEGLHTLTGKVLLFALVWAFAHHLLAGIRYLLIDIDLGLDRPTARLSAWIVILTAPPLALLLTWGLL